MACPAGGTSSYVGFVLMPPVYPEVVASTPSSLSKGGSMHQKQPPANVATALPGGAAGSFAICAGRRHRDQRREHQRQGPKNESRAESGEASDILVRSSAPWRGAGPSRGSATRGGPATPTTWFAAPGVW